MRDFEITLKGMAAARYNKVLMMGEKKTNRIQNFFNVFRANKCAVVRKPKDNEKIDTKLQEEVVKIINRRFGRAIERLSDR